MRQRRMILVLLVMLICIVLLHINIYVFPYNLVVRHLILAGMAVIAWRIVVNYEQVISEFKRNRHNSLK